MNLEKGELLSIFAYGSLSRALLIGNEDILHILGYLGSMPADTFVVVIHVRQEYRTQNPQPCLNYSQHRPTIAALSRITDKWTATENVTTPSIHAPSCIQYVLFYLAIFFLYDMVETSAELREKSGCPMRSASRRLGNVNQGNLPSTVLLLRTKEIAGSCLIRQQAALLMHGSVAHKEVLWLVDT